MIHPIGALVMRVARCLGILVAAICWPDRVPLYPHVTDGFPVYLRHWVVLPGNGVAKGLQHLLACGGCVGIQDFYFDL